MKPKTAYDVRRYLTLVQVLALDDYPEVLPQIAGEWGVELTSADYLHDDHMIHTLAKHVVKYHNTADTESEA